MSNASHIACAELDDPDAFIAEVIGESMLPDFKAGDIVVFSPRKEARDGDACFVRYVDGSKTFKRVFDEGDTLRLQPVNPACPATHAPWADIAEVFPAVWLERKL